MYAVTGITGKVGGVVARTLLAAGLPVRAVVRNADKGRPWAGKGCEVAIASIADAEGLTKAFSDVDGVFLMTPPDFDPEPGFLSAHEAIAAHRPDTARSPTQGPRRQLTRGGGSPHKRAAS
jgi:NAD(P)H dehydrogenase (quinone)